MLCLGIYLLLQLAFIAGLPPQYLANGWHGVDFQSPVVQLASLLGLNFITLILYIDACISPSGTGIIYTGATARMLTAMSQDKQMPSFLQNTSRLSFFETLTDF